MSDGIQELAFRFSYAHGAGELQPYFAALTTGRAMARKCPACGRVWFPPHAACPEDGAGCEWTELPGGGVIVSATRTRTRLPLADAEADHVFVLVAMDGAANAAFGRLVPDGPDDLVGRRVRLATADAPLPAQRLVFELDGGA